MSKTQTDRNYILGLSPEKRLTFFVESNIETFLNYYHVIPTPEISGILKAFSKNDVNLSLLHTCLSMDDTKHKKLPILLRSIENLSLSDDNKSPKEKAQNDFIKLILNKNYLTAINYFKKQPFEVRKFIISGNDYSAFSALLDHSFDLSTVLWMFKQAQLLNLDATHMFKMHYDKENSLYFYDLFGFISGYGNQKEFDAIIKLAAELQIDIKEMYENASYEALSIACAYKNLENFKRFVKNAKASGANLLEYAKYNSGENIWYLLAYNQIGALLYLFQEYPEILEEVKTWKEYETEILPKMLNTAQSYYISLIRTKDYGKAKEFYDSQTDEIKRYVISANNFAGFTENLLIDNHNIVYANLIHMFSEAERLGLDTKTMFTINQETYQSFAIPATFLGKEYALEMLKLAKHIGIDSKTVFKNSAPFVLSNTIKNDKFDNYQWFIESAKAAGCDLTGQFIDTNLDLIGLMVKNKAYNHLEYTIKEYPVILDIVKQRADYKTEIEPYIKNMDNLSTRSCLMM